MAASTDTAPARFRGKSERKKERQKRIPVRHTGPFAEPREARPTSSLHRNYPLPPQSPQSPAIHRNRRRSAAIASRPPQSLHPDPAILPPRSSPFDHQNSVTYYVTLFWDDAWETRRLLAPTGSLFPRPAGFLLPHAIRRRGSSILSLRSHFRIASIGTHRDGTSGCVLFFLCRRPVSSV
jgi:hypothetical protein